MKKFLAVFLASVTVIFSFSVVFASDLSNYHFVSLPDFFSQYEFNDGNYLIPVDGLSNSPYLQSLNTLLARSSDSDSYYTFL